MINSFKGVLCSSLILTLVTLVLPGLAMASGGAATDYIS